MAQNRQDGIAATGTSIRTVLIAKEPDFAFGLFHALQRPKALMDPSRFIEPRLTPGSILTSNAGINLNARVKLHQRNRVIR